VSEATAVRVDASSRTVAAGVPKRIVNDMETGAAPAASPSPAGPLMRKLCLREERVSGARSASCVVSRSASFGMNGLHAEPGEPMLDGSLRDGTIGGPMPPATPPLPGVLGSADASSHDACLWSLGFAACGSDPHDEPRSVGAATPLGAEPWRRRMLLVEYCALRLGPSDSTA
jgi:hypothetical protein